MTRQLTIWQQDENPVVRMHRFFALAHFGHMETYELSTLLIMIAKLDKDASNFTPIPIYYKDVMRNSHGGNQRELVMEAARNLKKKLANIRIKDIERGKIIHKDVTVIDEVVEPEGADYFTINFGIAIRKYLLQLKEDFSDTELQMLFTYIKKTFIVRLILIVKTIIDNVRENSKALPYLEETPDELRRMLVGSDGQYEEYKYFKRDKLTNGQKALAETPYAFRIEEKTQGRKVTHVRIIPLHVHHTSLLSNQATREEIALIEPALVITDSEANVLSLPDELAAELEVLSVNLKKVKELFMAGEINVDYIRYVLAYYEKQMSNPKIGGIVYSAICQKKLWRAFENVSTKKIKQELKQCAPSKPVSRPAKPEAINPLWLDELEDSYKSQVRYGLKVAPSFEQHLESLKQKGMRIIDISGRKAMVEK